jgi:hypothetical protein
VLRHHWNNWLYGASKLHTQNNFSENCLQFANVHSKIFTGLVLGQKSLNNISFRGNKIITLHGIPARYGHPYMLPRAGMDVLDARKSLTPALN